MAPSSSSHLTSGPSHTPRLSITPPPPQPTKQYSFNLHPSPTSNPHPSCPLCVHAHALTPNSALSHPRFSIDPSASSPTTAEAPLLARAPTPRVAQGEAVRPLSGEGEGKERVLYKDGEVMFVQLGLEDTGLGKAMCSGGRHIVIIPTAHLPDIYSLGPSHIPLLTKIAHITSDIARRIPAHPSVACAKGKGKDVSPSEEYRVGFIVSPFKQTLPYPHIHLHALLPPLDLAGWYTRNIHFGGLGVVGGLVGWWELEDLVAEIRESTSNNRVKSGYGPTRSDAPLTRVLHAGSLEGNPNALDPPLTPTSPDKPYQPNNNREFQLLQKSLDSYLLDNGDSPPGGRGAGRVEDIEAGGGRGRRGPPQGLGFGKLGEQDEGAGGRDERGRSRSGTLRASDLPTGLKGKQREWDSKISVHGSGGVGDGLPQAKRDLLDDTPVSSPFREGFSMGGEGFGVGKENPRLREGGVDPLGVAGRK